LVSVEKYEMVFLLIAVLIPAGLAASFWTQSAYGFSGDSCWLAKDIATTGNEANKILTNAAILFYGPFAVCILSSVIFLRKTLTTLK